MILQDSENIYNKYCGLRSTSLFNARSWCCSPPYTLELYAVYSPLCSCAICSWSCNLQNIPFVVSSWKQNIESRKIVYLWSTVYLEALLSAPDKYKFFMWPHGKVFSLILHIGFSSFLFKFEGENLSSTMVVAWWKWLKDGFYEKTEEERAFEYNPFSVLKWATLPHPPWYAQLFRNSIYILLARTALILLTIDSKSNLLKPVPSACITFKVFKRTEIM